METEGSSYISAGCVGRKAAAEKVTRKAKLGWDKSAVSAPATAEETAAAAGPRGNPWPFRTLFPLSYVDKLVYLPRGRECPAGATGH